MKGTAVTNTEATVSSSSSRRTINLRLVERSAAVAVGDAVAAALGAILAYLSWDQIAQLPWSVSPIVVAASALGWSGALLLVHGYASLVPRSRLYSAVSVVKASVPVATLGLVAFFFFGRSIVVNRPSVLFSVVISAALVMAFRTTLARLLLHSIFATPAILVTDADISPDVIEALDAARFEYRITSRIALRGADEGVPQFRRRLAAALQRGTATDVLIDLMPGDQLETVTEFSVANGFNVRRLSTVLEQYLARVSLQHVAADWLLDLPSNRLMDRPVLALKRCMDITLAVALCTPLCLLTPIIALAIRCDSAGPVFLRQKRVGQFGREFTLLKFRTMRLNAEADGPQWSSLADTRITTVGRILRKTRLDEWPQVVNVWRGEMSFIGPRPERPEFMTTLEKQVPHYRIRLLAKPGLTGWAQVKSGYAASVADSARKLEYDLYYVKYRGLRLDFQVLMLTVFVVLGFRGR